MMIREEEVRGTTFWYSSSCSVLPVRRFFVFLYTFFLYLFKPRIESNVCRIRRVRSSPTLALPEGVLSWMRFTFVRINGRSVSRDDDMEIHRSVVFHILWRTSRDEMRSFRADPVLQREETRWTSSMFPSESSRRTSDDWSARLVVYLHRTDRFLPRWWTRTYPTMQTIDRSSKSMSNAVYHQISARKEISRCVGTTRTEW